MERSCSASPSRPLKAFIGGGVLAIAAMWTESQERLSRMVCGGRSQGGGRCQGGCRTSRGRGANDVQEELRPGVSTIQVTEFNKHHYLELNSDSCRVDALIVLIGMLEVPSLKQQIYTDFLDWLENRRNVDWEILLPKLN